LVEYLKYVQLKFVKTLFCLNSIDQQMMMAVSRFNIGLVLIGGKPSWSFQLTIYRWQKVNARWKTLDCNGRRKTFDGSDTVLFGGNVIWMDEARSGIARNERIRRRSDSTSFLKVLQWRKPVALTHTHSRSSQKGGTLMLGLVNFEKGRKTLYSIQSSIFVEVGCKLERPKH